MQDAHASAESFDGGDSANVFERDVVDFQAMVARLSIRHPGVPVARADGLRAAVATLKAILVR